MKFLVIETSSEKNFAALAVNGKWVEAPLPMREQMKHLLPGVDHLLSTTGLTLGELDFIAVGNGPGSFTGTRIGVCSAKILSFAKKLPLLTFCSFCRFTPQEPQPFLLLVDAKSHGFYVYDGDKASLMTPESLEIPQNCLLLSPHPERIKKRLSIEVAPVTENPSFLMSYLETAFNDGQSISPEKVQVSYLHTP